MKLNKKKLAVVVGAAMSLGVAGQASADVYGLSSLNVNNLSVVFESGGGATFYNFNTDANASLNGVADGSDGSAICGGQLGVFTTCTTPPVATDPRLSGTVQNAPGGAPIRGENDYTAYGQVSEYSSAESAIVDAFLLGDASTATSAISESNLVTGTSAAANTLVQSSTNLSLTFNIGDNGNFNINFDAIIDVSADVNGGDAGLAQANSSVTVELRDSNNQVVASWTPKGTSGALPICGAGLTCTSTETALDLNNSISSGAGLAQVAGAGSYGLAVTGLTSGDYTLGLASNTSTQLIRAPGIPLPGTLLLLGTGLLLGARATRRNKK